MNRLRGTFRNKEFGKKKTACKCQNFIFKATVHMCEILKLKTNTNQR